jgi:hypothetical protein
MFEAAGSLAVVQPVLTLVFLVAVPLLWAAIAAVCSRSREVVGRFASIGCGVGTLALAIALAVRLALLPRGCVLVQHVAQLARLGQLDLAFDLALDPRGTVFVIIVAIVGCASTLQTSVSSRPGAAGRLAWTGLVTGGAMLLCVGDGFAPILVGLGILSLGTWGLASGGDPASNVAAIAGNVSVLLGFVFLFWSLGGAFGPEGYDPDGAPRFVLVTTPETHPDQTTLTMTTHAGALVSSDDADLPNEPIASPFSISVQPGIYTLRVQGGAASGDVVVPRVAFAPGRVHVLTPYGPTASLRALDDQFAVPRLAPSGRAASVRAALTSRTINGLRASAIVLLLVLGGALAHLHALASRRGPSALVSVLEALPAPYLALRLSPLVEPSAADGALVLLLGAGSAIVLAARAACVDDGHKALRGVLAATAASAVAASGLADPSAALILASSSLLATSAALAAIEARRDIRWLGMACAGTVGLLPGAGASSGWFLAIFAALGSAVTTKSNNVWVAFAALIAAALVAACLLGALAVFRVYDAIIRASAREPGHSRLQGAVAIVLSVLALVGGTVLGGGTTVFGGHVVAVATRLTGAPTIPAPPAVAALAVVLSLIAAAAGVILARRVSAQMTPPGWLLALGRPYAVLAWTASGLGEGAAFLQRSVRAMDRDVVDDIPRAAGDVIRRVARLAKRPVDPTTPRPPLFAIDENTAERVRTVVLLVMVVLLTLVVLSSLLLG